jgi:6-phosphogluconolactonase
MTTTATDRVQVLPSKETLADQLYNKVTLAATTAIATRGVFHLALSGGSLPDILAMGIPSNTNHSLWHIWYADERCVPIDHKDSNHKASLEALAKLQVSNVHTIQSPNDPVAAAKDYQSQMSILPLDKDTGYPRFDMILLGMGPDGHTCSLFPAHPLLASQEWVAPILDSPKPPPQRITLTLPVLNAAANIVFVVTGDAKASVLHDILDLNSKEYPSALGNYMSLFKKSIANNYQVHPTHGTLLWLLDEAAASRLKSVY